MRGGGGGVGWGGVGVGGGGGGGVGVGGGGGGGVGVGGGGGGGMGARPSIRSLENDCEMGDILNMTFWNDYHWNIFVRLFWLI